MFFSVALIHPTARAVPLLTEVAREVIADVELLHMVDEGIRRMIGESGGMTEPVTRRVSAYAMNAQEAGTEAVMLASPLIGRAIDVAAASVRIPVLRIDEGMAETAVQFGDSAGVVASDDVTLEPTVAFLRERADAHGKSMTFRTSICDEAARALAAGDLGAYDDAVVREVEGLAGNDMVILADLMMYRVIHTASERVRVPVLGSPRHGFEDLAKRLNYFRR